MANTIKIKNTGTASATPNQLEYGELAINYADGKLFYKNSSNLITELQTSGQESTVTLSDTPPLNPENGDLWFESDTGSAFVYYDFSWVEVGGASAGGATNLDALTDVIITDPAENEVLSYNGTSWENAPAPEAGTTLQKGNNIMTYLIMEVNP